MEQERYTRTYELLLQFRQRFGTIIVFLCGSDLLESFLQTFLQSAKSSVTACETVSSVWNPADVDAILREFVVACVTRQMVNTLQPISHPISHPISDPISQQHYVIVCICLIINHGVEQRRFDDSKSYCKQCIQLGSSSFAIQWPQY